VVQSELKRYEQGTGRIVDFRKAYWTPPVSPDAVLASETSQIEQNLGLAALVSITDHDTIAAGLSLQLQAGTVLIPVSVEWTVPFAGDFFHIGVHHLPPARASQIMENLSRYTAQPAEDMLGDLFAFLNDSPETLLVLNHPCWDVAQTGAAEHASSLRTFLSRYRPWIHALEINGLRSWSENKAALRMGEEYDLPVVAGGDRHGCRPNTLLNLSQAATWADFVAEIRFARQSDTLILPTYEEPLALRQLEVVADALRCYPHHPYGQRRFTNRTFVNMEGYSVHPLSFYWEGGVPFWLRPVLAVMVALGNSHVRSILKRMLLRRGEIDLIAPLDVNDSRTAPSLQKEGLAQ